jgi:hypothetical protein
MLFENGVEERLQSMKPKYDPANVFFSYLTT